MVLDQPNPPSTNPTSLKFLKKRIHRFMNMIRNTIKKSFIGLAVVVQVFGYSMMSFSRVAVADVTAAPPPEAAVSPAPCPDVSGVKSPTGAASHTYTFNPDTCTWENAYYSWSPVTKQYTPKFSQTPVYNPDTNAWEHTTWDYVSSDGQYAARIISIPATLAEQIAQGDGPASISANPQTTGANANALAQPNGSISAGNGTDSDNSVASDNDVDLNGNFSNNVSVLTTLDSNANSGNASVLQNTTVGDVATGNATAIANILNMIQSSWDPTNGDLNLFSADLFSNYTGDLLFDPSIALGNGTGSTNVIDDDNDQNLTLNVENNANITNDINLNVGSGNATANANTTVGDVSTGDATAVANVINMINSMITSGKSFIGSINLHGDLNGDILLPRSLMEILLGNGTGSSNSITGNNDTDIDADLNNNSNITNNTNLTADSGNAVAENNTTVGNLSTGNASTNVNEMNLVGQNVQGTKGLLVFVNVLGSWVGMLFGSPGTSSIVGGNGSNSTNSINSNNDTNVDLNVNNNYGITNNLNLNAASGDATASRNTTVGDVSTGNASSGVNLLNMINSNVNFTDWFGVLFINVFGNWQGSFGENTVAGNKPAAGGMGGGQPSSVSTTASTGQQVANLVSRTFRAAANGAAQAASTTENNQSTTEVLTSTDTNNSPTPSSNANATNPSTKVTWALASVAFAAILLGLERFLSLRRRSI